MRVIGIDPGLTRCGVAVLSGAARKLHLELVTVIKTPVSQDLALRLAGLYRALTEIIEKYQPEELAVERVFAQHNSHTVIQTAQASGIAMLVGAVNGLSVASYTPSEVKAAISGSGRADKAQVGYMVSRILGLAESPKPADAADAVAIGICHLWRGAAQKRVIVAQKQRNLMAQQAKIVQQRIAAAQAKIGQGR